jgi:hypothetical protein
MPANPDFLVTEFGSSHALLIIEAKAHGQLAEAEPQLKRYLWKMSCPLGMLVSPQKIVLLRNRFTGYSDDSIERVGEYPSPESWRSVEGLPTGFDFEAFVYAWLEKMKRSGQPRDVSPDAASALSELVLPSLTQGEIHAAGPRATR